MTICHLFLWIIVDLFCSFHGANFSGFNYVAW
uniref:Uncharacterized protein n=1 Tax=Rhizophora mucronata TaxID=61149 RepID=A0A2P2NEA2_RHIMU